MRQDAEEMLIQASGSLAGTRAECGL